jgi:hypothetical protein
MSVVGDVMAIRHPVIENGGHLRMLVQRPGIGKGINALNAILSQGQADGFHNPFGRIPCGWVGLWPERQIIHGECNLQIAISCAQGL